MTTPAPAPSQSLDSVLTGLALFEAWQNHDEEMLTSLTATVEPDEAIKSLLRTIDMLTGMFAAQLRADTDQIIDSVRRRIVREIASGPVG